MVKSKPLVGVDQTVCGDDVPMSHLAGRAVVEICAEVFRILYGFGFVRPKPFGIKRGIGPNMPNLVGLSAKSGGVKCQIWWGHVPYVVGVPRRSQHHETPDMRMGRDDVAIGRCAKSGGGLICQGCQLLMAQ